ncbi:hypothetical protein AMATHDRAFT_6302 [Amanita thiersii Skay4041]|uniref:T6SS Phospholipase effector Tle1-like catalytic domain-containing protein n=1 Tax=Amanita thiersii Skay4041 TaxID=703135 RepID=A0A2A9NJN5_9AGAR|nr:hypothetical protein AMATHDRAFT_6302 [Amanita thiersii Skay4041]
MSTTRHAVEPTALSATETVFAGDPIVVYNASPPTSPSKTMDGIPKTTSPADSFSPVRPKAERVLTMDPTGIPPVIPPDHPHRNLILCFDGTGDQFDADNSNIVQLVSMLKKDDKTKQMVYYQAGIGTYISPSVATPFMSKLSKTLDEMLAWNLDAHVMSGYEFLMQNYVDGDKICIFGFSRGAYTARSLAGMIHKVGLLPADNFQQVPFAYKMYTRTDNVGWEQSNAFKKAFSVDVKIEFLGVWDTVDSVGMIPKRLPFTTSNTIVRTFRHAISLDEHRAKFKTNLWNRPNDEELKLGIHSTHSDEKDILCDDDQHEDDAHSHEHSANGDTSKGNGAPKGKRGKRGARIWTMDNDTDQAMNRYESIYSERRQPSDIEEVWFAGCHCDVGGGSVANGTRHSLARIPLRWMVRECFKANTGILFKSKALREIGLDPTTLYPFVTPRPPPLSPGSMHIEKHPEVTLSKHIKSLFRSKAKKAEGSEEGNLITSPSVISATILSEEEEELRDALSPIYDQLKMKRSWWLLEVLPLSLRYQKGDNQWITYIGINMGKSRFIPKQHTWGVKVHRSVKIRMDSQHKSGKKYKPKANFHVEPTWID